MVDDNQVDLDIGRRFYGFANLENPFLGFSSGEALLEYLNRAEKGEVPDPAVVLLDVNMPQLDGFETLKRIRGNELWKEIPVIVMLTNSDNPKDVEKSLALGANGYQAKHFEIDEFVAFMRGLFE